MSTELQALRGARIVRRDGGAEVVVDLTLAGVHLGRGQDCAVRTEDPRVSRRNTRIAFSAGRWCVDDLGSVNGTFVNGERVTRAALRHGDVIRCGSLEVRFLDGEDAPLVPPPTLALTDDPAPPQPQHEMRADSLRQRIADLERQEARHDEEARVLTRLGNELRDELSRRDDEMAELRSRLTAAEEELTARDRQLERAHDEVAMERRAAGDARAARAAAEQHAEQAWRDASTRDDELENLRRICREQEHLLRERTVGLTSLEAALQELRADRERLLRESVAAKQTAATLADELATLRARDGND